MSVFDRFLRRHRAPRHQATVAQSSVPSYRVPPPPPAPPMATPPVVEAAPRPVARPAMRLMLADGSIEDLADEEMEARAEYLIKAMLPPAPPPPPVSS